jgi:uncharacterized coiled-coil protein SlyX
MANQGYTVKEMLTELRTDMKKHHTKMDDIHTQTKLTNGRLTALEPRVTVQERTVRQINLKIAKYSGVITTILIMVEVALNYLM